MSAEPYSASLISRFTLPLVPQATHGYYRSKLFMTASTTNPLVAAAGPLLSLIERLSTSQTLPAIEVIRENIDHELNAFQSRLKSMHYADEFGGIAHYLLSVTLDELLGKNYMRLYGQQASFHAFTPPSSNDISPQQRFFDIIDYITQRATQYLDLVELSYYCLIAGFEGEYHQRADGRLALDNLIQTLYDIIEQHRVYKPLRLFNEQRPPEKTHEPIHYKPFLRTTLLSLCMLMGTYVLSQLWIEHKANLLFKEHVKRITLED